MHLIEALAAGIAGGGNGTVDIFRRDTATRVEIYTSFEGDGATTPVAASALDSNGSLVVYVNEVVDVVVRNSAAVTIRSFTCGVAATCVEVISDSFLGVNYSGGGAAASRPTTLAAILNLVNNSFGDLDWLLTGDTPLSTSLQALAGIFYNVKSYGAVGDGVTNDASAITAAITAAQAAGGGTVFFPPGIYTIGATVTMTSLVSFQGAGAAISVIRITDASSQLTARNVIQDITVESNLNLSGPFVSSSAGFSARRSVFGSVTYTATASVGCNAPVVIGECTILVAGQTQIAVGQSGSSLNMRLSDSTVYAQATTYTGTLFPAGDAGQVVVSATRIELLCTTGGGTVFKVDSNVSPQNSWAVAGTTLSVPFITSSTITWFDFDATTAGVFSEAGNTYYVLAERVVPFVVGTTNFATTSCKISLQSRDKFSRTYADDSSPLTIDSLSYGLITVERGNNSAQTVTIPSAPVGSRLILVYYNNQGSTSGTITLDTTRVRMEAASNQFTVAANSFRVFEFVSILVGTTLYWAQVAEDTVDEPE